MHPQLSELIDVCAKHEVTHVVLAGGLPPGGAIERIKGSGAKLICFAPALALAKKLMRSGADALVIEGMEAGGHIGPVSTSVLAQEILPHVAPTFRCSSPAGSAAARRSPPISKWARSGSSSARASSARRMHRPRQFQEGVHPRLGPRRDPLVQIDPRLPVIPVRALKNREMENFAAKQREVARSSTRARSKWPRPSSRSSIIGPARCAAR
jgi:enoyl-[acyl-carrier protein] reductase II